jgi:hypothetical protein
VLRRSGAQHADPLDHRVDRGHVRAADVGADARVVEHTHEVGGMADVRHLHPKALQWCR